MVMGTETDEAAYSTALEFDTAMRQEQHDAYMATLELEREVYLLEKEAAELKIRYYRQLLDRAG